jgi:hypothetical protein
MVRWERWLGGGSAVVLGALSMFAGHDGGRVPVRTEPAEPPANEEPRDEIGRGFETGEKVAETLGRAFRGVSEWGSTVRERVEGLVGVYRLLRGMGMSDREIAALVAEQARIQLGRGLEDRKPTAADIRRVVDSVQETVVRSAQEVDTRLNLGGDFSRRVREGVQASKAGREDAIIFTERGLTAAREQLLRLLRHQDSE